MADDEVTPPAQEPRALDPSCDGSVFTVDLKPACACEPSGSLVMASRDSVRRALVFRKVARASLLA